MKDGKVILMSPLTPKIGPSWPTQKINVWRGIKTKLGLLIGMIGMSVSEINLIIVHNLTWQLE